MGLKIGQKLPNNCILCTGIKKNRESSVGKGNVDVQLRWHNQLDPSIVKKSWSTAEEDIMFEEHKKLGNKWTIIA
jgi:hypothetical protein